MMSLRFTFLLLLSFLLINFSLYAQNESNEQTDNLVTALLEKGDSLRSLEKTAENARKFYKKAIILDPNNPSELQINKVHNFVYLHRVSV